MVLLALTQWCGDGAADLVFHALGDPEDGLVFQEYLALLCLSLVGRASDKLRLAYYVFGSYCTNIVAYFGADVI